MNHPFQLLSHLQYRSRTSPERPTRIVSRRVDGSLDVLPPGDLRPADVLCGRGKRSQFNAGNLQFRDWVNACLAEYSKSQSHYSKNSIISSIVRNVKAKGGRFLKFQDSKWVQLSLREVKAKVGHAIRDALKLRGYESLRVLRRLRQYSISNDNASLPNSSSSSSSTMDQYQYNGEYQRLPTTVRSVSNASSCTTDSDSTLTSQDTTFSVTCEHNDAVLFRTVYAPGSIVPLGQQHRVMENNNNSDTNMVGKIFPLPPTLLYCGDYQTHTNNSWESCLDWQPQNASTTTTQRNSLLGLATRNDFDHDLRHGGAAVLAPERFGSSLSLSSQGETNARLVRPGTMDDCFQKLIPEVVGDNNHINENDSFPEGTDSHIGTPSLSSNSDKVQWSSLFNYLHSYNNHRVSSSISSSSNIAPSGGWMDCESSSSWSVEEERWWEESEAQFMMHIGEALRPVQNGMILNDKNGLMIHVIDDNADDPFTVKDDLES